MKCSIQIFSNKLVNKIRKEDIEFNWYENIKIM
jgi:hypothetical protein